MARQIINVGTSANDGTGDTLRVSQQKANANFADLYDTGGAEITVNNPVTLTPTDLDTALADLVGTGGAVDSVNGQTGVVSIDLESVLTEGNIANALPIKVSDVQVYNAPDDNYFQIAVSERELYFNDLAVPNSSFTINREFLTSQKTYNVANENGTLPITTQKTANFTAELYCFYTANGTLTVTDPTPVTNLGFIVHVIGGSVTIGGVAYTSGALVYRYYDGSVWISTNMNSTTLQDLESVLTEGNESTTQDAIFRLDVDKYIKINRATQRIELWDETIDDTIPITHWDKDSFYIKDATGNQMSISAGYTNNLLSSGGTLEIFGSNIVLTDAGTSLNLTNELMELNNGIDSVSYRVDKIVVNGVDYPLPTGATSQIATLLDLATKQDTLVSGTNIKTLEGQSLLGSGNIDLTKSDVGLSNVDNTSDANKPVSTAQQTALDLKANLASPALTGTPTAPTQSANDNSTKIATTAYADAKVANSITDGVTTIAPSQNVVFDALDTKVTFWSNGADGTSVANTLTITPTYSQLIPANTFSAGDVIDLECRLTSPGAKTSISNLYFYVNTANNLSGATQLAIGATSATGRTIQIQRKLSVKGATTKTINPAASTINTDLGGSAAMTPHTIDWTVDQWLIFAIGHTVADQTMFGDFYKIQKT